MPNWNAREPPDPSTGFELAWSGVAVTHPNPPLEFDDEGFKLQPALPPTELPGVTKWGVLKMLKTSARTCAFSRSVIEMAFVIEASALWKPEPRKGSLGSVPLLPYAGGVRTPLPNW